MISFSQKVYYRLVVVLVLTFLFVFSCSMGTNGPDGPDIPKVHYSQLDDEINIQGMSRLGSFGEASLGYYSGLEELAMDLDKMALEFALPIIQSEGFPEYYQIRYYAEGDIAMDAATDKGSGDYSTNNQVSGVEEVDVLQSNGTQNFVAVNGDVLSFSAQGQLLDREALKDDGYISGLLLSGDRLLAIISNYNYHIYWDCFYGFGDEASTELVLMAVDSNGQLTVLDRETFNGQYIDARMVDGQVILSSVQDFDLYSLLYSVADRLPESGHSQESLQAMALEVLREEIPQWRNRFIASVFGSEDNLDLAAIQRTAKLYGLAAGGADLPFSSYFESFQNLYCFDMSNSLSNISRQGFFSSANGWNSTLYADGKNLILANDGWVENQGRWEEKLFLMHLEKAGNSYIPQSFGTAQGHSLNQFSLDVYQDVLRVATSSWAEWDLVGDQWVQTTQSESRVTLFDLNTPGTSLNQIGLLDGLGLGEMMFAVRFMGDKGYMVTFEQVDPFYTLDLSNPRAPRVMGELVIPGFSTYLQQIAPGQILAIGQDNGLQVALFDVSDMANPRQAQKYVFPGYSYSSAEWDHHAFRYVAGAQKLIIPQSSSSWLNDGSYSYETGFSILNIGLDGINLDGFIEVSSDYQGAQGWVSSPRSIVIDQTIITVMNHEIQGHNLVDYTALWKIDL